jgi:hypothetical protein
MRRSVAGTLELVHLPSIAAVILIPHLQNAVNESDQHLRGLDAPWWKPPTSPIALDTR